MQIRIRFNTEKLKTPELDLPEWRVIYEGEERFARSVNIRVNSWTTQDEIAPGVMKWHITCEGQPHWDSEAVTIS
jgi:hypothetical protein